MIAIGRSAHCIEWSLFSCDLTESLAQQCTDCIRPRRILYTPTKFILPSCAFSFQLQQKHIFSSSFLQGRLVYESYWVCCAFLSVTNSLYERKFTKIQAGYERIVCKNTSVIQVKKQALTNIQFFQNDNNCFFNNAITQFLYGPFNGLSGLFKLELLSSDSFY